MGLNPKETEQRTLPFYPIKVVDLKPDDEIVDIVSTNDEESVVCHYRKSEYGNRITEIAYLPAGEGFIIRKRTKEGNIQWIVVGGTRKESSLKINSFPDRDGSNFSEGMKFLLGDKGQIESIGQELSEDLVHGLEVLPVVSHYDNWYQWNKEESAYKFFSRLGGEEKPERLSGMTNIPSLLDLENTTKPLTADWQKFTTSSYPKESYPEVLVISH